MTKGNAVCPKCRMYTEQRVVTRGVRLCPCGEVFNLKDTTRIQRGRVIYPKLPVSGGRTE